MNSLEHMNEAVDYIEQNLSNEIDYSEVARIARCSEYHFKRMFSFLAGMTLSEYVRKRRLTLAAFDLRNKGEKVIDIALKYGYHSPDAFTRAFQLVHGMTPTAARRSGFMLKAFPPMTFRLTIEGGKEMNYQIIEKQAFKVVGFKKRLTLPSAEEDLDISELLNTLTDQDHAQLEALSDQEPKGTLHLTTHFLEDEAGSSELDYYFAVATTKPRPQNCVELNIPAHTWAVFTIEGEWADVNDAWQRIYSEWFPMSEYEHVEGPEIMVSKEENTEIWIPIQKK